MKFRVLLLLLSLPLWAHAETWRFALIGDVPYTELERQELPRMIDALGQERLEFIAHIGDIKSGWSRCDDALYLDRQTVFNASPLPFVYVPGDNEWSDCDRKVAGEYEPLERLAHLRTLFWNDGHSLGQKKIRFESQGADFPEHTRFQVGPVLFVTLNLPGANNYGTSGRPSREFLNRNPRVIAWMKECFALARQERLAGIVLLFQADPAFNHFAQGNGHHAFREFLASLRDETMNFSGQVVAVHGDTHFSRIDKPMLDPHGAPLERLTRVETFGYPFMGWTLGVIDTTAPELFRFEPHPWPQGRKTR